MSEIVIDEFLSDYVEPKYRRNAKLCYVDKHNIIV